MLSIVVPVFNEAESLRELYDELVEVSQEHGYQLDVIFVDDGSQDDSWAIISQLAADDSSITGIRFRRNFGKAAALNAGFELARGELVMTLDADLQDDPHEIPRFLQKMDDEQLDVVSGWKQVRHDPWHKVGPSRVFNALVSRMTGVHLHDHNCGFKCYRREIFDEVRLYGELHRFVPVLAAARGYKVGEIVVNHRRRKFGKSKYGVRRILKGFLDLLTVHFLTGYDQRPQHLLGTLGLFCFLAGGLGICGLSLWWGVTRLDNLLDWFSAESTADTRASVQQNDLHLHQRAVFYYSIMAVLLGAQFMSIGFIAELITAYQSEDRKAYSIKERTPADHDRRSTEDVPS